VYGSDRSLQRRLQLDDSLRVELAIISVVNKDLSFKANAKAKDLTFKAKAKAKDVTSEHVQGPL